MNWHDKLTKTELKHFIKDAGCKTLDDFKYNREAQKNLSPNREICFTCKTIARKLGIEA